MHPASAARLIVSKVILKTLAEGFPTILQRFEHDRSSAPSPDALNDAGFTLTVDSSGDVQRTTLR